MSEVGSHFDQIQDSWLRLEEALYSFAPNYLSDENKRRIALRSEAAEFFANQRIKARYDAWGIDIGLIFHGIRFTIEDRCCFFASEYNGIDFDSPEWRPSSLVASGMSLEEFCEDMYRKSHGTAFEKAAKICNMLANRLMRMYEDGFKQAMNSESALIYARARSPLNQFTRIFPDQWRHFRIVDIEAGTAEGPTGETLFSCHVAPNGTGADTLGLAAVSTLGAGNTSKAAAVSEFKAWVISLLKASPHQRTHSMEEIREIAISRWETGFPSASYKAITWPPAWKSPPMHGARQVRGSVPIIRLGAPI